MSELVFKIMKAGGSFHAIDYNGKKEGKGQARLVHMEGFGPLQDGNTSADPKALKAFLEQYASRNTRIRHPQFHAILSVKGKSMETGNMIKAAQRVMNQLGYAGNPIAIYEHNDTANRHLHIITSRVGLDGRKINDKFEGIRAQQVLQAMLLNDPAKDFHRHMLDGLQYSFSSVRQFMLLMQGKGYSSRQHQGNIQFFKHGYQQGSIEVGVIKDHIKHHPVPEHGMASIRGIIEYEREKHDRLLVCAQQYGQKGGRSFSSPLTEVLKDKYGLHCVFFASTGQDQPHGYVIIDQAYRNVYKGSEIKSLAELTGMNLQENRNTEQREKEQQVCRGDGWRQEVEYEKAGRVSSGGGELIRAMDQMMAGVERDLEGEMKTAIKKSSRKNRNNSTKI
jgi:Relaxase/Mobilisation nuclease domain